MWRGSQRMTGGFQRHKLEQLLNLGRKTYSRSCGVLAQFFRLGLSRSETPLNMVFKRTNNKVAYTRFFLSAVATCASPSCSNDQLSVLSPARCTQKISNGSTMRPVFRLSLARSRLPRRPSQPRLGHKTPCFDRVVLCATLHSLHICFFRSAINILLPQSTTKAGVLPDSRYLTRCPLVPLGLRALQCLSPVLHAASFFLWSCMGAPITRGTGLKEHDESKRRLAGPRQVLFLGLSPSLVLELGTSRALGSTPKGHRTPTEHDGLQLLLAT